jgi:hypothetical protein
VDRKIMLHEETGPGAMTVRPGRRAYVKSQVIREPRRVAPV